MTKIIIIIILMILSAFFSASETAFSTVNKIRLRNYANQGNKRAERALKIVNDFDKALTAILIGNNIVNIASASLATIVFTEKFGASSVGIATIVMTIVVLIFGEILPKSLAKENAERFTLVISAIMSALIFILKPFVLMFIYLKKFITKIFVKKNINNPSVTEEELKYIIEEIEDEGVLEEQESDLLKSALEFDEIALSQILIPRVNIIGVEATDDVEKVKDIFITERYSRMPVYDKTMDSIVGIIHQKDFFNLYINGGKDITPIVQEALFFSEHKKISEVMNEMQRTKNHMAIVIDQYGGTEGLVTLEDIIEELVGEIYDENDDDERDFIKVSDNCYNVSGGLSISDFLEYLELGEDIIVTDCNSIGGWVMELLEHVAENGEKVTSGIFNITVLEIDEQQIKRVQIDIDKGENNEESSED